MTDSNRMKNLKRLSEKERSSRGKSEMNERKEEGKLLGIEVQSCRNLQIFFRVVAYKFHIIFEFRLRQLTSIPPSRIVTFIKRGHRME